MAKRIEGRREGGGDEDSTLVHGKNLTGAGKEETCWLSKERLTSAHGGGRKITLCGQKKGLPVATEKKRRKFFQKEGVIEPWEEVSRRGGTPRGRWEARLFDLGWEGESQVFKRLHIKTEAESKGVNEDLQNRAGWGWGKKKDAAGKEEKELTGVPEKGAVYREKELPWIRGVLRKGVYVPQKLFRSGIGSVGTIGRQPAAGEKCKLKAKHRQGQ